MRIDVLTLFPRMFEGPMGESIIGKAQERGLVDLHISNFRDFSDNKHQNVDDYPYGGGAGMLLKVQPVYDNLQKKLNKPHQLKIKESFYLTQLANPLTKKWPKNFQKKNI